MSLFYLPRQFVVDGTGSPRSGAELNFYQAGTLSRQDTYSDADLTTPNTNPVVANAAGQFGPIYLSNESYRVILTDSDGVTIYDQDDVEGAPSGLGGTALEKTANYTVTESDRGTFIRVTEDATVTLPAISTVGDNFPLAIINDASVADVTIDPGVSTVNDLSSLTLAPGETVVLASDGSNWTAAHTGAAQQGIRYKDEDTSRDTTTTLAEDPDLAGISIGLDTWYEFELWLDLIGHSTPDFKFQVRYSQTPQTGHYSMFSVNEVKTTDEDRFLLGNIVTVELDNSADTAIHIRGAFHSSAAAAGTLSLYWAQDTSDAQAVILHAGSFMKVSRLGPS